MTTNKQPINTKEEVEILRSLLDSAQSGKSVVRIDDAYPENYQNKLEPRIYVTRRIRLNHEREDIIKGLIDNYNCSEHSAQALYSKCKKNLDKKYTEYVTNIVQNNIETLRQIVQDSLEAGDRKTAIQALQEINKVAHLYDTNTVVNNTVITADTPIEIVFK